MVLTLELLYLGVTTDLSLWELRHEARAVFRQDGSLHVREVVLVTAVLTEATNEADGDAEVIVPRGV